MSTLPAPPYSCTYAPQGLAAAWVFVEVVFVWMTGIVDDQEPSGGLDGTLVPVALTAALPATLVVTWMHTLCAGVTVREKWPWVVVSAVLIGLTIGLFARRPAIVVVPLAFAIGNAAWFFAYRAFGRGVLLMRGRDQGTRPGRLSTRKIMALTLSVSVVVAIIRWLSKLSPDEANLAIVGIMAINTGLITGGCSLSLAIAIMKPYWGWYVIHFGSLLITGAALFAAAVLISERLQVEELVSAAAAWLMTLIHFAIFCGVLRTSGYRFRFA